MTALCDENAVSVLTEDLHNHSMHPIKVVYEAAIAVLLSQMS
jgi:hypothetical protein